MPSVRLEGRNGEVWQRYAIHGWTQARIAEHFGISQARVSTIITEIGKTLSAAPDGQELIKKSYDFLLDVQRRVMEIADLAGAPVAVGKDGEILYDPDTGAVVRDFSGRLRALETAMKVDAQVAKRFGLDAPDKVQVSGEMKYEIVGVPMEDLK